MVMMGWILGAGVMLVVLLILWPKLAGLLPASWSGSVTTTIATASDAVTDAVTQAAFTTLAGAGWANDDLAFLAKLAECRAMQKAWNTTPAVVAPSVEALAATVADLQAKLASQTTTTIPDGAVAKG